jgi:RHS repeat-associated protein
MTFRRFVLILIALMSGNYMCAQTASPIAPQDMERQPIKGFFPATTFAASDIENVNTSSGALGLQIPITTLPPGRGGLTGGIGLVYSSKQWQATATTESVEDRFGGCYTGTYYNINNENGGWGVTLNYHVRMSARSDTYPVGNCVTPSPNECPNTGSTSYNNWKYQLVFPDRSVHDLAVSGAEGTTDWTGYFNIAGDGSTNTCSADTSGILRLHSAGSGSIKLYTTDGTYLRVQVNNNFPADEPLGFVSMTLSFPDGRTVVDKCSVSAPDPNNQINHTNNRICTQTTESVYDRNGHSYSLVEGFDAVTVASTSTLTDEFGNTITVTQADASTATVTQTIASSAQPLVWTLGYETLVVPQEYTRADPAWDSTRVALPPNNVLPQIRVLSSLVLPAQMDSLAYQFTYGPTGEVSTVTLPSGASLSYINLLDSGLTTPPSYQDILNNALAQKTLNYSTASHPEVSNYVIQPFADYLKADGHTAVSVPAGSPTTVSGPDGGVTGLCVVGSQLIRTMHPDGSLDETVWVQNTASQVGSPPIPSGNAFSPSFYNPMVQAEYHTIVASPGPNGLSCGSTSDPAGNPSSALTSAITYAYDPNGFQTASTEYDFVPYGSVTRDTNTKQPTGTPGTVIRSVASQFNAPLSTSPAPSGQYGCVKGAFCDFGVGPAIGASKSPVFSAIKNHVISGLGPGRRTDYCYDNSTLGANVTLEASGPAGVSPLVDCGIGRSSLTVGATAVTHVYDTFANLTQTNDPRNNPTTYEYGAVDCSSGPTGLYVTKTTDALSHAISQCYDSTTGLATSVTDANNVQTTTTYDSAGRPSLITRAPNTLAASKTQFQYSNSGRYALVKRDLDSSRQTASIRRFDQIGRVRLEQNMENGAPASLTDETVGILTTHTYGYIADGRCASGLGCAFHTISNPYRSTGASDPTTGSTRIMEDQMGRPVETQAFDNVGSSTGRTTQTYSIRATGTNYGRSSTATDPASIIRTTVQDASGRLSEVDEACANCLTSYTYDSLDSLTGVAQGVQSRTFTYDFRKLLQTATNPESGQVQFSYDANGNVVEKRDQRLSPLGSSDPPTLAVCYGAITGTTCDHTGYDALNRLTRKSYVDGSTPTVTYNYDSHLSPCPTGASYPALRLTAVRTADASTSKVLSTTSYDCFDPVGQVTQSTQKTSLDGDTSYPYQFSYAYNLAGELTQVVYPSGRIVNMTYDSAGRPNGLSAPSSTIYVNSVSYNAHGAIGQLQLNGTHILEQTCYNSRLEPILLRQRTSAVLDCLTGASPDSNDLLHLALTYGTSYSTNNGNPSSQKITALAGVFTQNYTYDNVGRIATASETGPGTGWNQTYSYDQFGNNWVSDGSGLANTRTISDFTPTAQTDYDATNHQILKSATYNGDGTLKSYGGYRYSYDGENRLHSSTLVASTIYGYDGAGLRVWKQQSSGTTTIYVYDAGGQLAAEYQISGQVPAASCGTCYLMADPLGSTRMETNGTAPVGYHDYLPFGEELTAGITGRDANWGAADPHMKFTGKLRDDTSESGAPSGGLDYFGFRYYSGAQGRFTGSDAPFADQSPADPQSWNMYAYVRNNPLKNTDPNGRDCQNGFGACLSYIIGGLNGMINVPSNLATSLNHGINAVTGLNIPDATRLPSIGDEQKEGEESVNAVMLFSPLAELGTAKFLTTTEIAAGTAEHSFKSGSFSISDWTGYPTGVPKPPEGTTFRLVEGTEYQTARTAANQANRTIRQVDPAAYAGREIHEITPVKFGGNPTNPANKVALPASVHRQQVTPWWNQLKKSLEKLVSGGSN